MSSETEFQGSHTRDKLKSLMEEGMQAIEVRDGAGRIETLYEAHVKAVENDICLITQFKYADGAGGTSRRVIAWREILGQWPGYDIIGGGNPNDFNSVP
jgi:hypothetical protein